LNLPAAGATSGARLTPTPYRSKPAEGKLCHRLPASDRIFVAAPSPHTSGWRRRSS